MSILWVGWCVVCPAMVFLIAAEYVAGGDAGFGYRIRVLPKSMSFNVIYIYLVILGASGLLMDWGLTAVRRKLCPWFGE